MTTRLPWRPAASADPVPVLAAADVGRTGHEPREQLDKDVELKRRLEAIRRAAGPLMTLGDVADRVVPKIALVAPPRAGGAIATRSFIPHMMRRERRSRPARCRRPAPCSASSP